MWCVGIILCLCVRTAVIVAVIVRMDRLGGVNLATLFGFVLSALLRCLLGKFNGRRGIVRLDARARRESGDNGASGNCPPPNRSILRCGFLL